MKLLPPLLLLALGSAACQSNSAHDRSGTRMSVDDKALVQVPVSQRDAITKARTESEETRDRIAVAKRDVQNAKDHVTVAEKEVAIAKDEVDAADKRVEVARETNQDTRATAVKDAEQNREAVRAHRRWADAQVCYQERRVDEMDARLAVENLRAELADAKVELAKAKAVNALDRSDLDEYDVGAFEARVADRKMKVAMAEVDADAWDKKIKLCRDALEDQAKAVPASYRDGWRKVDDVKAK
jgi:chromosome segregation ATPase